VTQSTGCVAQLTYSSCVYLIELENGAYIAREIRPDDKRRLEEGLAKLSSETVYRRFLSPKPSFSSSELRYLTEVDGHDHFALAVLPLVRPDMIVAVGRFVRLREDPEAAEVAIVVADPLQGRGLGRQLATLLGDAAVERGIRRFTADIQSENQPALKLMRRLSRHLTEAQEGTLRHLESELAA
jgi:RimJ/RimL family protein N-acetyltransferase